MKAITVDEMIKELQKYEGNRILCILRDGSGDLYPITKENWCEYKSSEEYYFPNSTVSNDDQPAIRIGTI